MSERVDPPRQDDRPKVYVDTNAVIRGMERTDVGADEIGKLMDLAERGGLALVTSELTLSEVLVGPIKRGDDLLFEAYVEMLTHGSLFELLPVSRDILLEASHIRARSSAPLPDCVHVASALLSGCKSIISFDRRLGLLSSLDVVEPSDKIFQALGTSTA